MKHVECHVKWFDDPDGEEERIVVVGRPDGHKWACQKKRRAESNDGKKSQNTEPWRNSDWFLVELSEQLFVIRFIHDAAQVVEEFLNFTRVSIKHGQIVPNVKHGRINLKHGENQLDTVQSSNRRRYKHSVWDYEKQKQEQPASLLDPILLVRSHPKEAQKEPKNLEKFLVRQHFQTKIT